MGRISKVHKLFKGVKRDTEKKKKKLCDTSPLDQPKKRERNKKKAQKSP